MSILYYISDLYLYEFNQCVAFNSKDTASITIGGKEKLQASASNLLL